LSNDNAWTAAILAGGQATRLDGRNKAALRFGRHTLLERQLAVVRRVVGQTVIIANDPLLFCAYDVPVIPDLMPGTGPLGGVYTAIQATNSKRTLVLACDMPFLTASFLSYLIEIGEETDIAIPRTVRGYEPLCATYSRRCAGVLRHRIDARRLKISDTLAGAATLTVREIGPDEIAPYDRQHRIFCNVNTPDEYARAVRCYFAGGSLNQRSTLSFTSTETG
jgi:molybdopterin-guanine dinucleotide biosynthesis protein A